MVAISARQASSMYLQGNSVHGGHDHGYGQPSYPGPLASNVPAGVNGQIIPVSETFEVAAARDQFFRAYQNQLDTINAIRAGKSAQHDIHGRGPHRLSPHGFPGSVHVSHGVQSHGVQSHGVQSHTVHGTHFSHSNTHDHHYSG